MSGHTEEHRIDWKMNRDASATVNFDNVNPFTIGFYGGAGTVTGSRHLLTFGERRVLIDSGLFQGLKQLRLLNWEP